MIDHRSVSPEPNSGCWLWMGALANSGYGEIAVRRKKLRAHRISWEKVRGEIPPGMCVLHNCDTPACVNPDHLFLGTRSENAADKVRKGRQARGVGRGAGVLLSDEKVRAIMSDGRTHSAIARSYGVARKTISDIREGRTWFHVTGLEQRSR